MRTKTSKFSTLSWSVNLDFDRHLFHISVSNLVLEICFHCHRFHLIVILHSSESGWKYYFLLTHFSFRKTTKIYRNKMFECIYFWAFLQKFSLEKYGRISKLLAFNGWFPPNGIFLAGKIFSLVFRISSTWKLIRQRENFVRSLSTLKKLNKHFEISHEIQEGHMTCF